MKYFLSIVFISFSIIAFAQKSPGASMQKTSFTPEQQAVLQTKKMVLNLGLSTKQEEKILALNKKWAAERQALMAERKANKGKMKDLTSEQRYEMMKQHLDRQIAHQEEIKKILKKNQFEKWIEMRNAKMVQSKSKMHKKMHRNKSKKQCMRKRQG